MIVTDGMARTGGSGRNLLAVADVAAQRKVDRPSTRSDVSG
jgi:hypothetical protein